MGTALSLLLLVAQTRLDAPTCAPVWLDRPTQLAPPVASTRGQVVVEEAQCGRCHALPGSGGRAPAPRERSCAGCHAWIHASREDPAAAAQARQRFPRWDRYQENVKSFLAVPDLTASAARLDEAFLARYLRAPFKVRPYAEGMLRTGLDEADAAAAATWLAAAARRARWSPLAEEAARIPLSDSAADVKAGAALFTRLSCAQCHAHVVRPALTSAVAAPDLRLVRERMRAHTTAAFIADPPALGGQPTMPGYAITAAEAARLRDYLWATAGTTKDPALPLPTAPPLTRPVSYADIRREILDAICIHCHMDPRRNGGEGGPGNTGGLGYRGVGLDLETWDGIVRGARDERGRHSILASCRGGEPPLVARLRARFEEHAKEIAGPAAVRPGGPPGMPLGLAPLTPAQLQLLLAWVAQGARGPDGRPAPVACHQSPGTSR
jgi:mono/diheme cytochrome c family protein